MNNNVIMKICVVIFIGIMFFTSFNTVSATSFLNDILKQGGGFFNPSKVPNDPNEIGTAVNNTIASLGIIDAIVNVGNLIFIIITSLLGVKYIFAGSADKADIKNSLITLSVAIIFFFLAQTVYDFANGSLTSLFGFNGNTATSYTSIYNKVWNTISIVIRICSVLGIVLVGLRYMLASANTRADIKGELMVVVVGIILVYSSISVINFVIKIANSALTGT